MTDDSLIIFVRRPVLGQVKTRIAKEVGDEKALKVYTELLHHTRRVTLDVSCSRHLFYTNKVIHDDEWHGDHYVKHAQAIGDLGHKMKEAFRQVLSIHPKAVIIGSDCAQLTPKHIEEAFAALDHYDTVIGPSLDGGYYLLGMKKVEDNLFDNMTWSTDSVCSETLRRLKAAGLTNYRLEVLSDIDYWADWQKYGWQLP